VGVAIGGRIRSRAVERVDRRTFLMASTAAGLMTACSRGGGADGDGGSASEQRSARVEWLVPTFPDGFQADAIVVAGIPQRISFVVRDNLDIMRSEAPDAIDVSITFDGSEVVKATVGAHTDGIITPYYPIDFEPPRAGRYTATTAGASPVDFIVEERTAVPLVQVGDPMRPVATPTIVDDRGVDPICTRAVPCPFHEISLDEALTAGRPTVLLVATPGFCQTDICGPVVDLLIDAVGDRDDLAVIHGEVYVDPSVFTTGQLPSTTPVVETYALPFEPQLLVADASGTVIARLDTVWDRTELAAALDQ
jgi:hypothetical protein